MQTASSGASGARCGSRGTPPKFSKQPRKFDISQADLPDDIGTAACAVLRTPEPDSKTELSACIARAWRAGELAANWPIAPPNRPARPARPELLPPGQMPRRRRAGTLANRIALLHAIAHIELNAIDLAWDAVARFGPEQPKDFTDDWVKVAAEEAVHFLLLQGRLAELGSYYGALPAHDGLWQAAEQTADDVMARLAIVPLVLEARGLDVTPSMIERAENAGDDETAKILRRILEDEIGHVAAGAKWFRAIAMSRGQEPAGAFRHLVETRFSGRIKGPFNTDARLAADFPADFWG